MPQRRLHIFIIKIVLKHSFHLCPMALFHCFALHQLQHGAHFVKIIDFLL